MEPFALEEQHIVPTFRLSPFQALSPFIRITPQKNCPHSLDFKLVPVYWKNGDNFFRSDSDIRKSNVIMKHEWLGWHQMVQFFIFWWTISVSVFRPSCCKGWITIRNNLFEDFVRKLPRIRSSHECLMNQINKRF